MYTNNDKQDYKYFFKMPKSKIEDNEIEKLVDKLNDLDDINDDISTLTYSFNYLTNPDAHRKIADTLTKLLIQQAKAQTEIASEIEKTFYNLTEVEK